MSRSRHILLALALWLTVTASAEAQYTVYGTTTLYSGGTNKAVALSTNTPGSSTVLDATKSEYLPIQILARPLTTNYIDLRIQLLPSLDNSTFSSRGDIWNVTIQGATNASDTGEVCISTNLPAQGIGYFKLLGVANVDYHSIATNITIIYGTKR